MAAFLYLCGIKSLTDMKKYVFIACVALAACMVATLPSCNVTRSITTESCCYQRGDTSVTIVTKTIETYDATRR